jgi:lipoyl(octanoyl) transferase
MKAQVNFQDLGLIDYQEAWNYQEKIFKNSMADKLDFLSKKDMVSDVRKFNLLFCEHPHVYTLGKSGVEKNLLIDSIQLQAKHAKFYKIDRGGDITYHGPGQLVAYPIIDLEVFNLGVRTYIENLEESIIQTIAEFGLKGERLNGATGVWLDANVPGKARKICAIGVKASRYITMHGFAFNVNTDLNYFSYINPCGFIDKGVTSLSKELGKEMDMEEIKKLVLEKMTQNFKWKLCNL